MEFSQSVIEKIGYYVYALKDPRNDEVFYIGKGESNRIFQHAKGIAGTNIMYNDEKLDRINEIKKSGNKIIYYLIRHGMTEKVAFEVESALIDLMGVENLTNEVLGHDSSDRGIMNVDEIIQEYDADEVTITDPVLIITLNRLYKRNIPAEELYQITRHCWKLSNRRDKVKYAIAAYRGIAREVYTITSWNPVKVKIKGIRKHQQRWEFEGDISEENIRKKYKNKSLEKYVIRGAQNPIKYINC